ATLILPQLWAMSIGPLLNVDHFTRFMTVIKQLSTRVETEHTRHLAELKRLEESSGAGARAMNGPANTGTGAIRAADVTDFESLVRGNVNGAARGSQVDIFADESPAITPMSTGMRSPPLPALPTASPPFASTASFASPVQPVRPSVPPRLSSAPLPAHAARNSLGARPVGGGTGATAFSSAPLAGGTGGPSSLRSFAPLQPGPSRTVTSASLASSSSSSAAHHPNYNLSLATTPSPTLAAGSGLPSLQPTSSSLFTSPPPAPATAAAAPVWNRVASLSPSPSPAPAPAPANFPPGYNPAAAAALQPTVVQRPGQLQGAGAGGARGGAMDFGNWADLDPLK
ncbi:hypothetical protein JCM3770_003056, partial [Rhodotorula araucariae]